MEKRREKGEGERRQECGQKKYNYPPSANV
jgi:hypothetical protein